MVGRLRRRGAVDLVEPAAQHCVGRDRGMTGRLGVIGGEDRQRTVADQLEHVAAILGDRRDHRLGIIVEQRNDFARRRAIGDAGEPAQIAVPQHGAYPFGDAAPDQPAEHPPAGIAAEIGLDQRAGDAGQRYAFDRQRQGRHQPGQRRELTVIEASGRAVDQ